MQTTNQLLTLQPHQQTDLVMDAEHQTKEVYQWSKYFLDYGQELC